MSERILRALMQLFAIIAPPDSDAAERRGVVGSFLKQQLNQELVDLYLKVFDEYYAIYQKKQSEKTKRKKSISLSSVKVLKICTAINEELTQKQKVVVLIRLLEFIKADFGEITEQEQEFVEAVADTFHISMDEYQRIKAFVLYSFDEIPNSSRILIIDNQKEYFHPKVKHIFADNMTGQVRVFSLQSVNMHVMRYLGSKELYLNGQLLQEDKVYVLSTGSSIRNSKIKTIYYSDIISTFNIDSLKEKIVFEVKNLEYKFKGGKIGLHDINFTEESGRMVGIMGASGAGKSTLLNVLNGTYSPSSGGVLINGINIHTEPDKIEGLIGHVSQDDLLIEELTVFQNLYYNAKLCFDNYSEFQIVRAVLKLLQSLGLYEIKDMKVGSPLNKKISGGQRKRLNISLELIREPAILFLDEPTSGLSSRDSENIMDLLKELALKGKLVFVVIHQPSSDIFKMFNSLLILDVGGYLIYDGDPIDSIIYFKSRIHQANWNESECPTCGNVNPEQIFNIVESQVLDEYGNLTKTRKTSPKEWNDHYCNFDMGEEFPDIPRQIPEISFKIPNKFRQFKVFTIRDVLSKLADTQYLFLNLLEAPFLAFALSFIIKYYNVDVNSESDYVFYENSNLPVYIFMAVIIAIFIGLTVSAEEIISDRKILKREQFLNLSRASYLMSKVVILMVISAIQALTFVLLGNTIMEISGFSMYFRYWIILFSAFTCANLMGLNISDAFKTVVTIYILIPFLVIPQMILSGIIVKYDKLNPEISTPSSIPWYGEIITARWAYEALAVYQFKNNKYESQFYEFDKAMSQATFKKDYWIRELKNKVANCKRNVKDPEKQAKLIDDLTLLHNEITLENKSHREKKAIDKDYAGIIEHYGLIYDNPDDLSINSVSQEILQKTEDYLNDLNKYYIKRYNKASDEKNKLISELQKTQEDKEKFIESKKIYSNENLNDLVRNEGPDRIIEYDGKLYQKIDPVFQDPSQKFIKAHFYAPRKQVFGTYFDTFWINLAIIWIMTIILYITLYYSLLKRTLDTIGNLTSRFSKKEA